MIGKTTEKYHIIRQNAFEHKKKKPRLSANQPSNNWAQGAQHMIFITNLRSLAN